MALTFNGTTQYISATASPLGTGQLGDHTVAFWARAASQASTTLFSISRSTETGGINNPSIFVQNRGGRVTYFLRANASSDGNAWNGFATPGLAGGIAFDGTWHHVAARLSGTTSSTWVDGSVAEQAAAGATVPATTGMDRLGLGAVVRGNVTSYAAATIAEVGIWSSAITSDEIVSLARAASPLLVRPQSLVFYAPLIRDLVDMQGGLSLTNNSATIANHPRVYA